MWPHVIVVVSPECQLSAGIVQAVEQFFVKQLIPQAAVEALDEGILLWFSRINVMPVDIVIASPFQDCPTGELRSVVTDDLPPEPSLTLM